MTCPFCGVKLLYLLHPLSLAHTLYADGGNRFSVIERSYSMVPAKDYRCPSCNHPIPVRHVQDTEYVVHDDDLMELLL